MNAIIALRMQNICDKNVWMRLKGEIYSAAVKWKVIHGLEIVRLTRKQEADLDVDENS